MRFAVWLLLLAGCDQTWNLDPVGDSGPRPFDPDADCPDNYDLVFVPGSKFRIAQSERSAWGQHGVCTADRVGFTHLAIAPTRAKLDALIGALTARPIEFRWWIGSVQPTTAMQPAADWLWVTGEPVDPLLWSSPEPNDGNGIEDNHEDQFAFIEVGAAGLIDAKGLTLQRALCECDGRPVTAEAQAAVDQSRN